MTNFKIGSVRIKDNINKVNLMNCANNHESGVFFTGQTLTSYASLSDFFTINDAFNISFDLKSRTMNGVILFIADTNSLSEEYSLLEIVNGDIIFTSFNNNDRLNSVKITSPISRKNQFCDSSWFKVSVSKEAHNSQISLEIKGIDTAKSIKHDYDNNNLKTTDNILLNKDLTLKSLFIGALPERSVYSRITKTNEPFIGCIRDLIVTKNNEPFFVSIKPLLEMNLQPGVLNYCPLK
jgi:hypothetical protein